MKTRTALSAPGTVLALALAGCGGGSGSPPVNPLPPVEISFTKLKAGETVRSGTYTVSGDPVEIAAFYAAWGRLDEAGMKIESGKSLDVGGLSLKCSGSEECGLEIDVNSRTVVVTGTIEVKEIPESKPERESTSSSDEPTDSGGSTQPVIESQSSEAGPSNMDDDQGSDALTRKVLAAFGNGEDFMGGPIHIRELTYMPKEATEHFGAEFHLDENPRELRIWSAPPNDDYHRVSVNDSVFTGEATYNGNVIGYAYHGLSGSETGGGFNADITLNANFVDESVSGTVSNFSGPGAGSDWGTVALEDGGVIGGAVEGGWSHEFYRKESEGNPDGATGTVDLKFSDGRARGAYNAD
ncbi:MAG: hypothetical protein OXD36_10050 [Rhodobacter sp.]|nr:hypothetical protein [Rhodobacter sp.]MCY4242069.1 hypothetical protein [Rhodobacter sp.]